MNRKLVRASLAGLLCVGLSGCATLSLQEDLNVSVTNVRPAAATLLETGVQLSLRLTNESTEPVIFSGSSHKLFLNGRAVGRGVSNAEETVPGLDTRTVTVTVYLENLKLLRTFRDYQNIRTVEYRLESRLHLSNGRSVTTIAEGSLDVSEFTAAVPSLADHLQ